MPCARGSWRGCESRPKGDEGLPDGATPRARATRRDVQRWSHLKDAKLTALIMEHNARYPGCVVAAGAREGKGKGGSGGKETVYVYAPERTAIGVTATPIGRMNPTPTDDESAGQWPSDSVSPSATPNERDTESATPNPAVTTWPDGSIGAAASQGTQAAVAAAEPVTCNCAAVFGDTGGHYPNCQTAGAS